MSHVSSGRRGVLGVLRALVKGAIVLALVLCLAAYLAARYGGDAVPRGLKQRVSSAEETVRRWWEGVGGILGLSEAKPKAPSAKPPVPVSVAAVIQKTIPRDIRAIGNVEAYSTVAVKTQVSGELTKVCFEEGQDVKKGDLLFTIDPRPFEAALQEAEANVAQNEAKLKNAESDARRYTHLMATNVASSEQFDTARTTAEAFRAAVLGGKAAVAQAKLQVEYCSIRSPINGRTGAIMVNQGNIVKANEGTLVIISQVTPIYVTFSVPEQYLTEIKKFMAAAKLQVAVTVPGDEEHPVEGEVTFLDHEVDIATGTIQLKATFLNQDRRLWPGQFVTVSLTLTSEPNAILVPSQAVQNGQEGQYVFVLKEDLTVEYRLVKVRRTVGADAVISEGLKSGEKVVTDGQLRLVDGKNVEIKPAVVTEPRP